MKREKTAEHSSFPVFEYERLCKRKVWVEPLPTYIHANTVIDNRHLSPDELAKLLREQPYSSPFTAIYPRNTKEIAIATLKTLPKKCVVIDFESTGLEKDAEIVEIGLV